AADLRGVSVWRSTAPDGSDKLVDASDLDMATPSEAELVRLRSDIKAMVGQGATARQVLSSVAPLSEQLGDRWVGSLAGQQWMRLTQSATNVSAGARFDPRAAAGLRFSDAAAGSRAGLSAADDYARQLTQHLTELICRPRWSDGAVANGVALRARGPQFRGDLPAIYESLKDKDCPAGKTIGAPVLQEMSAAADTSQ
ncbi:MAG: hypothetical protein AAF709_10890, partial [Pseudomonadota bacterium]